MLFLRGNLNWQRSSFIFFLGSLFLIPFCSFAGHTHSIPVGFVRVEVGPKSAYLASLPFVPFDDSIQAIFGDQLKEGDRVLKWSGKKQSCLAAFKLGDGFWYGENEEGVLDLSEMSLLPGEGFWIENRQEDGQSIYLSGRLILEASREQRLYPLLNLVGYPFSSARAYEEGKGSVEAAEGPANLLELGRGYWYEMGEKSSLSWERPYADLFGEEDQGPAITALSWNEVGDEVTLTIATEGTAGEVLEIYYKDLDPSEVFESAGGWKVAAEGLATRGKREVTWTDSGQFDRIYLVGRGDLDLDGNGVADARQQFVGVASAVGVPGSDTTPSPGGSLTGSDPAQREFVVRSEGESVRRCIYVDGAVGRDSYDGLRAQGDGGRLRSEKDDPSGHRCCVFGRYDRDSRRDVSGVTRVEGEERDVDSPRRFCAELSRRKKT